MKIFKTPKQPFLVRVQFYDNKASSRKDVTTNKTRKKNIHYGMAFVETTLEEMVKITQDIYANMSMTFQGNVLGGQSYLDSKSIITKVLVRVEKNGDGVVGVDRRGRSRGFTLYGLSTKQAFEIFKSNIEENYKTI